MRDRLKAVEMMNRLREIGCADTAYVSIGVIYRTVTCTVRLSPEALAFLSSLQLPVEIASYPASDD
ncbi:MAG TPA: hypothetical protein VGN57_20425 [Pirellulaceae bacterium]|nr:hypothetical protein [Pirellulaceae bacterium]